MPVKAPGACEAYDTIWLAATSPMERITLEYTKIQDIKPLAAMTTASPWVSGLLSSLNAEQLLNVQEVLGAARCTFHADQIVNARHKVRMLVQFH